MPTDTLEIYLPFLDNVIGYDCAACQATCCRTGNIGALRSDQAFLQEKWPLISTFQRVEQPHYAMFRKTQPHCWFLREDGWCRIEVAFGKEHKPHMCRSHPIYLARLLDSGCVVTSVAPYCRWVTGDLSEATGTLGWEEARSLHREGVEHGLFAASIIPASSGEITELVRLIIAAEERIRDEVLTRPDLNDYLTWQTAFTRRFLANWDPAVSVDDGAMHEAQQQMTSLRQAIGRFLHFEDHPPPRELSFAFPLFASIFRMVMLESFFSREAIWRPNGEARTIVARIYRLLPRQLTALVELTRAYAAIGFDESARPNYNTVNGFLKDFSPRVLALSCLDAPFGTLIDDLLVPDTSQMETELDQLLDLCNDHPDWSLAQLLEVAGDTLSAGGRMLLLDDIAVSIDAAIVGQPG